MVSTALEHIIFRNNFVSPACCNPHSYFYSNAKVCTILFKNILNRHSRTISAITRFVSMQTYNNISSRNIRNVSQHTVVLDNTCELDSHAECVQEVTARYCLYKKASQSELNLFQKI